MRRIFPGVLVLVALPLFGAGKHPPRDVFPELKHERVDYWVAEFSSDKDYHKKIADGFERIRTCWSGSCASVGCRRI
jgi:hypothetical protein